MSEYCLEQENNAYSKLDTIECNIPINEELLERINKFVDQLRVPYCILEEFVDNFVYELKKGLEAHRKHPNLWIPHECSFKMLDSCISDIPSGKEKGTYYAIDFGGTNFRAVRASLDGNGKIKRDQEKYSLKFTGTFSHEKGLLDKNATATQLFDHFAERIKYIMGEFNDLDNKEIKHVGFTFSFPCTSPSINCAILIDWTKGFETGRATNDPVEGRDVCKLMNEAFARSCVPAKVCCVVNDSVGTLMSCAYQKGKSTPPCYIGVILGTGSNGSYYEPEWKKYKYSGKIINIEFGNFDKDLPLAPIDLVLDWYSSNRSRQLFEKMISGAYLGEIVRRYMVNVLQSSSSKKMWISDTFNSESGSVVLNDTSKNFEETKKVAKDAWDIDLTDEQVYALRKICEAVYNRSAGLAAAVIAAIAKRIKIIEHSKFSCGIDGSLYVKNAWYCKRLKEHLKVILADKSENLIIIPADDGSGKGAAITAAVVASSSNILS
ncbi:hexokinase, putative [Plasmodium relictum]|uniref:Phosphotransferase n=1 Tax=Plasmodium relictum TaxID=85471 RepID=A0A1J1H7K5_PLARL|nr:hexokinase, putative [Plasmodium relictum]CRH00898.1 hexokinase, putative [Plasmodium relictum]